MRTLSNYTSLQNTCLHWVVPSNNTTPDLSTGPRHQQHGDTDQRGRTASSRPSLLCSRGSTQGWTHHAVHYQPTLCTVCSYIILRFHSFLLPPTPITTRTQESHGTSRPKRSPCTLGAQHLAEQSAKGMSRPSEAVRCVLLTLSPQHLPAVCVPVNRGQNQAGLPSKCCMPWLPQCRRELANYFQWAEAKKHCSAWWGPWTAKDTEIPSHFHNASNSTGFY